MSAPVSTATAPHYAWGDGCDGWHLVRTDALSVIEERMPSGTSEIRHRHARSRQFFYVLAGSLSIEADGVTHEIGPGIGIEVRPGIAHQTSNTSSSTTRFLVISQPPSHGDRIS